MSSRDDMGAMNRYVTLQPLGDGTYGSVMLGQRVDTGEKVTPTLCFVVGNIEYQIKYQQIFIIIWKVWYLKHIYWVIIISSLTIRYCRPILA